MEWSLNLLTIWGDLKGEFWTFGRRALLGTSVGSNYSTSVAPYSKVPRYLGPLSNIIRSYGPVWVRIKCAFFPGLTRGWGIKFCSSFLEKQGGAMITFGGIWWLGVQVSKRIWIGGLIWAIKADESQPSLSLYIRNPNHLLLPFCLTNITLSPSSCLWLFFLFFLP